MWISKKLFTLSYETHFRAVIKLLEKLYESDKLRNTILSLAETYEVKSSDNRVFKLKELTKAVSDSTILFNDEVASEIAKKQLDIVSAVRSTSVYGRIQAQSIAKFSDVLKFAKTQKKVDAFDTNDTAH